jgi:EAL domain-containing protein (putative c-di-GMP-specific phosphodiesterase class I)
VALDAAPRTRQGAAAWLATIVDGFLGGRPGAMARADDAHARALEGGFDLVFQPIVDLESRRVHHREALTRLPDGGSPVPLVTFAEEAGLVADFDLLVCRRVVELLGAAPADAPGIAVNLSGRSLESGRFVEALLALVGDGGRLGGRLLFELTETADIHRPQAVAGALQALRRRGFEVCLDDFGSGASAFHYLRAFEVDYLKIDGVYVRHGTARERAILAGMAALCRELGVAAIAEMVEDEASVAELRGLGIRYGQGFLFGRPRRAPSPSRVRP